MYVLVCFRLRDLLVSRLVPDPAVGVFAGPHSPRSRYILHGGSNSLVGYLRKNNMGLVSFFFFESERRPFQHFTHFRPNYAMLPAEGVLTNVIGVVILCYGVLSLYLVNDVSYKRNSLPEENLTLADNEEHQEQADQ